MKGTAMVLLAFLALPPALQRVVRESNSSAEAKKAMQAYKEKKYAESAKRFAAARQLKPSTSATFDEGTARAAAGDLNHAIPLLTEAAKDPELSRDALFNRGTAELQQKQFENAIRDLASALRISPDDVEAKRNLELALQRKQQQEKQQQSSNNGGGSGGNSSAPQPQPKPGQQPQGNPNQQPTAQSGPGEKNNDPLDSILKSVQEQEKEELNRMRGRREDERAIGW